MRRKLLFSFTLVPIALIVWQYELLLYGISQGMGQLKIVYNARPNQEVLEDPAFPDSLKQKIRLVEEIRKFAFDSLGIKPSENYTTTFDQKGKPILYVITASDPYELKAKKWNFPFLGSFSYKGFFDYEKALAEEKLLKQEGLDTSVDEVGGWSTLGWFKDPILSNMLYRSPGNLANLIIHELTHGTLYVKDNVEYNENLASFVGDKGALIFLRHKYGEGSKEYEEYLTYQKNLRSYSDLVLSLGQELDSMYQAPEFQKLAIRDKEKQKKMLFREIKLKLSEHPLLVARKKRNGKYSGDLEKLNNTYFLDFKRYREKQDVFEEEFTTRFNSDFRLYLDYLKQKYPSL